MKFNDSANLIQNETGLLMPIEGYIGAATTLFLIGFFGFFFNLFVIILMWKDKQLWTPLNLVLFNLVCSDFSVSILGNPWTLASAISGKWIFGRMMCKIYGFFMSLLGISSITTLTVLSFERYIIISKPFRNIIITRKGAAVSIFGIWTYSLSLTLPPLLGWGDYVNEAANISCSVNWEDRTYDTLTYIVFLFAFGLIIPVTIIGFSYTNIILTMKQSTMRSGRVAKTEGRITLMIFVMIVAFLIAWTPYAIMALIIQFGDPLLITPGMGVIPALVAKSSICYNPIIYVGMNAQFRQAWRQLFKLRQDVLKKDNKFSRSVVTNLSEFPTKNICQYEKDLVVTADKPLLQSKNQILKQDKVRQEVSTISQTDMGTSKEVDHMM